MLHAAGTFTYEHPHPPVSSYPLCFDTLAHTCVQQKSQPLSLQPLPHTWSRNTRGGIPLTPFNPLPTGPPLAKKDLFFESSTPTSQKTGQLTPSFSDAAFHFFRTFFILAEISPAFAISSEKCRGWHPSSPKSGQSTSIMAFSFLMKRSNSLTSTLFQSTQLLS